MKKINVMEPKTKETTIAPKKRLKAKSVIIIIVAVLLLLAVFAAVGAFLFPRIWKNDKKETSSKVPPIHEEEPTKSSEDAVKLEAGYVSSFQPLVPWYDENGNLLGDIPRGTQVEFLLAPDGREEILWGGVTGYLEEGAEIVSDSAAVVPAHTLYVRTAVNLRDAEGRLLPSFLEKGRALAVNGYDRMDETGAVHMYRVSLDGEEGYILPWYLAETAEEAMASFDNGNYGVHASRGNRYGGGDAASLDYYPRNKGKIEGNEMPEECRALYLISGQIANVHEYIEIADQSGINAFVVDISDGHAIGYAAEVMNRYCPSAASAAKNTVEEYKAAIQKIKDAGYYVIGRITTFNDSYFINDHPEFAIADQNGSPLKLSGAYWPTAYNRTVWQYKVDLALEAVELMGFHEIQFDYVRFPDNTSRYEKAGSIDFRNAYGETKAQAIQRFLMFATDVLHEKGVYVSADVYGESAYTYVTAYGQYWPAISGVVDVISGMPYPDHFAASGTWLPWEHPYEVLNKWGANVMLRQGETASPAVVRTWIQAYNAIRKPYNTYGVNEVAAQIKGLRDAGCTGGYMTWNAASSLEKYRSLIPAFEAP